MMAVFIIAGTTFSFPAWEDGTAVYLIKTDSSGIEQWSKAFGGRSHEFKSGNSVQQTDDGGFIIAGRTSSIDGDRDVYLIKTDGNGNEQWSKTFGGSGHDSGQSVQQTDDGGFIIAGRTSSIDGVSDVYLIKTDSSGIEQWSKTFGGSYFDDAFSVKQTDDGGFVIIGSTRASFGFDAVDVYLIKTDGSGNEQWSKTFGGSYFDSGNSVQQTDDGGFIIAGRTFSFGAGGQDVYIVYYNYDHDPLEYWTDDRMRDALPMPMPNPQVGTGAEENMSEENDLPEDVNQGFTSGSLNYHWKLI